MLECIPDWVAEVANDMDVCVAQRDFEKALLRKLDHFGTARLAWPTYIVP